MNHCISQDDSAVKNQPVSEHHFVNPDGKDVRRAAEENGEK